MNFLKRFLFLSFLVILVIGCAREVVPPPPPEIWPSRVVTSEGMRYEVNNLRLPGTRQELKLRAAGTTTWIPLSDVANIRITGPICEQYRPARIFLLRGGRLEGELFVDQIIEGTSDQGYWNMPMAQIEALDMGSN